MLPIAHAFGQRYESPVPLWMFLAGGAAAVLVSFALVYGREVMATGTHPPADVVPPRGGRAPAIGSVVLLALLVACGLAGSQVVAENLLPTAFWVFGWVAAPLLVGVVGDFTGPLNPFAAIARGADRPGLRAAVIAGRHPVRWPAAAGYWVAATGYLAVVVGELIVNGTATLPRVTAAALAGYAVVCAAGGLVFGADAWNTRAELFTVMFATWGRLGYRRFRAPGRPGFAGGLAVPFDATASRVVGVLLLLVSVTFDGLLSTPQWQHLVAWLPATMGAGTRGLEAVSTLALLVLTTAMLGMFGAFAAAAARAGRHGGSALGALTGLLPSLLPIAYGYLLAHYVQYILINGQLALPLLGNPLGQDPPPVALPYPFNDSYEVNTSIMPTAVVWYVQIAVIISAHIIAVVIAHRHLHVSSAGRDLARRAEWPWLAAMVGYTMISLWLLAQPLIEQPAHPAPAAGAQVPGTAPAGAAAAAGG